MLRVPHGCNRIYDKGNCVIALKVNGTVYRVPAEPDVPLLWVLRDALGLKGTKYGCGVGICGICTVLVDGQPAHACMLAASDVENRKIVTIEGLAQARHPLLDAWIAEQVPQCGYCQPGQIVTAAALLSDHPRPTRKQIDEAMSGVLCRCGTYQRIRLAIHRAARAGDRKAHDRGQNQPAERPAAASRVRVVRHFMPDAADTGGEPMKLDAQGRFAPNPWVRIAADGTVTLIVDRSEMGQGVVTSLAMLVAEELEVAPEQIRTEFAPADPAYSNPRLGEQVTGGSTSVRAGWQPLRRAGATAREMLIAAAASVWGVACDECRAANGHVMHLSSGRLLGYGALAETAATLPLPAHIALKSAAEFRLLGKPIPRIEIPDMVAGRTQYGLDSAPADSLFAVVLRSPVFGGRAAHFAADRALAVQGVRHVLPIESGIAVVADSFHAACKGREALQVTWDEGSKAGVNSAAIRQQFLRAAKRPGDTASSKGDANAVLAQTATVIEGVYETPYLAHATLEPMNCAAQVRQDGCDVWVPTQAQQGAQETAARASGLPKHAVRIHTTYLGGGFGRRLEQDFVAEAVHVARAIGAPVQVVWTRDDDLQHDFYRPANYTLMRAALRRGKPIAWWQRIVGPGLALDGADVPYAIANIHEEHVKSDPGVPTGAWRAVGASQNAFAIECFIDELAYVANKDPFEFRRTLLAKQPRHKAVLELAAAQAGWGRPLRGARGMGIATYHAFASWVAQVAEVSVAKDGCVRVHRVVCAIDCGMTVNPDTVAAQMEGAVAFGLSAALHEAITIEHGRVAQKNFEDYPLLRLREMPEVEVHIMPSAEPPGGVGEPGVPPVAPAVANAIFAATGQRLRALPLRLG